MHPRFSIILAGFVGLALAGCANANVTPGPSIANPASQAVPNGVNPDASYRRAVYVYEINENVIKLLSNKYYRDLGVITNVGPGFNYDLTMDQHGNLYAANSSTGGGNVNEYAPGATSPSFTYNANMTRAYSVTVDRHGNVYAGGEDTINEYFQGFNNVAKSCSVVSGGYGNVNGLAVDTSGDVFASIPAGLYEFKGGLGNCNPTQLGPLPYGTRTKAIVLDSNNDIIANTGNEIAVIPPPYSYITRTFANGEGTIYAVSLNKKNKLLFVAATNYYGSAGDVLVYNYQTGDLITTLGSYNGISDPVTVVDGPNAVY